MSIATRSGSPQFPAVSGSMPPSSQDAMDSAIETLRAHKDAWVKLPISKRVAIVDELIKDFAAIAQRWVDACLLAKGIAPGAPASGEEWAAGAWPMIRNLSQLRQALVDIEAHGRPRIPGPVVTGPDGQVVAQVFPQSIYDRLFFFGITAEVWMEPGVTVKELPSTQAVVYTDKQHEGKVVLFTANPVNASLGPLIEESFRALIEPGFLRVVYGGAAEGAYLCNHAGIDEIHITGSDKTFEAIVFGPGSEGAARKAEHQPLLTKRVTAELGNVSPVIVVPGPWSESDIAYHAEHLVTMLTNNAGFNCNATRVIIQHSAWAQRDQLLREVRHVLSRVPPRSAYYPGAQERQQSFVAAHPGAEQFGTAARGQLPWTLVTGVDPRSEDDVCFTTEAFCGLFAETNIDGAGVAEYLDRAVAFANEHLWGTLNATLLVHPASLKDPAAAAAVDRANTNLRYGTVAVNCWAAAGYTLCTSTWGAFPGHDIYDIQSGTGVVHNTLMFDRPQKTVIRAPFRIMPVPPWFVTHGNTARKLFPKLTMLEASPSLWKIPGIMWTALQG